MEVGVPRLIWRAAVRCIPLVAALLAASGCQVLTIHPPFDEADLVYDEGLVGTWQDAEGDIDGCCMLIYEQPDSGYRIVLPGEDGAATFTAQLFDRGGVTFLDILPELPLTNLEDTYGGMVTALHLVARIDLQGDSLSVATLEQDFVEDRLESSPLAGGYTSAGGDLILNYPTEVLSGLITDLADEGDAWDEEVHFLRWRPPDMGSAAQ